MWHWQHFESPQTATPGSVMPRFEHLLVTAIDFEKIKDRVRAAKTLGASYDFDLEESSEVARKQAESVAAEIVSLGGPVLVPRGAGKEPLFVFDTQAVALISYLQRLGVDLSRPAPSAETQVVDSNAAAVPTPAP
jgi:cytochrome c oxidase cbb3-type subunit I/II